MRFSRDGAPYKTYLAAGVGGYYISLMKDGLYVGTGIYKPEPRVLEQLRGAIDDERSGRELARIVAALRKAEYQVGTHDTVASSPRGYRPDHPRIELLRMKDIHAGKLLEPTGSLLTPKALDRITRVIQDVEPLKAWLARYVSNRTEYA